jgi:DNA-directed RNA polymerase specialized sigma24 family protein
MSDFKTSARDLQRTSFEALLLRLHPDREHAGSKYEEIRQKLIRFFDWNDCSQEEGLADEVFDRVALKLETEDIRDVIAFTWGVARNVLRESRKRPSLLAIDDLPLERSPHTAHPERQILNEGERQRRIKCLQRCIQKLSPDERELFLQYEYYRGRAQNTAQLARRMGTTIGALQTKAHRIKQKVEKCALQCFGYIASRQIVNQGGIRSDERRGTKRSD